MKLRPLFNKAISFWQQLGFPDDACQTGHSGRGLPGQRQAHIAIIPTSTGNRQLQARRLLTRGDDDLFSNSRDLVTKDDEEESEQ